ncbi:MAG TPA: DUF5667 domain-containing protein, partial [Ardenticatenaceae bacterium]|nr:DUF5667 domain-containing protein [Ardenticatenaceae bacterium]
MAVYDDPTRPSRGGQAPTGRRSAVRTYDDPDAPTQARDVTSGGWSDDDAQEPPPPEVPPPARGLPPGVGRALVVLLALAALCGGGALAAAVSRGALPGDALYPLKNTVESTRLALASGDAAKIRVRLTRTENRAEELIALCREGRGDQVPEAVFFFQSNLEEAMAAVGSLEARDAAQADELEPDVQAAFGRYDSLLAEAETACPEDIQPSVRFATSYLQGVAGLPAGETAPAPTLTPTAVEGMEPAETDEFPTGTPEGPEAETPTATETRAPTATEEEATPTQAPTEAPTRAADTATARAAPTLESSPTRAQATVAASPTRPPPTFTTAPS